MIKLGDYNLSALKIGEADCSVYLGDTLVYTATEHPMNIIEYTSSEQLTIGGSFSGTSGQALTITAHTFSSGEGSIEFDDDLGYIGDSAFTQNSGLTSITMPKTVVGIGDYAFNRCTSISSITIPSRVTTIGERAFQNCSGLTTVRLSNHLTTIGNYAFDGCESLSIAILPNTLTTIGDGAYSDCWNLSTISFGSGVTSIGNTAFMNCRSLSSITIPNSISGLSLSMLEGCSALTSVTIPDSVASIGANALKGCSSLSAFTIPSGVTSIGASALSGCSGLTNIRVQAATPSTLGSDAFANTDDCPIYVPCNSLTAYTSDSSWSVYSSRIECAPITQYEYIRTENASDKYYNFNTGFYPTSANTFEVKVEFVDRSIDWGAIIFWKQSGAKTYQFNSVTNNYCVIVRPCGDGIDYYYEIGENNPTVYILPLSAQSGTYSINGGEPQTLNYNNTNMDALGSTPMGIFGDSEGKYDSGAVVKLYYIKVFDENGNVVKHYVPSDSNGTPCLYEIVDEEYIINTYSGADVGTLTLGPEISE